LLADDATGDRINTQSNSAIGKKTEIPLSKFINGQGGLDIRTDDHIPNYNTDLDNGTGYYDCGDEPDEDDSQIDEDEQEEFDECAEEDGEDDMYEEGEEETAVEQRADGSHGQHLRPGEGTKYKPSS
jgi:hypothetical protein